MALLYFGVIILALIASHPIRYKIWKTKIESLLAKIKCSSTFRELEDFELHEFSRNIMNEGDIDMDVVEDFCIRSWVFDDSIHSDLCKMANEYADKKYLFRRVYNPSEIEKIEAGIVSQVCRYTDLSTSGGSNE
jgi:hypothetical protein